MWGYRQKWQSFSTTFGSHSTQPHGGPFWPPSPRAAVHFVVLLLSPTGALLISVPRYKVLAFCRGPTSTNLLPHTPASTGPAAGWAADVVFHSALLLFCSLFVPLLTPPQDHRQNAARHQADTRPAHPPPGRVDGHERGRVQGPAVVPRPAGPLPQPEPGQADSAERRAQASLFHDSVGEVRKYCVGRDTSGTTRSWSQQDGIPSSSLAFVLSICFSILRWFFRDAFTVCRFAGFLFYQKQHIRRHKIRQK